MKKIKLISVKITLLLSVITTVNAQVGIETDAPKGALDIVSTTGGLVPPRMTEAQRDALNRNMRPTGSVIYNVTKNCIQTNEGTPDKPAWKCIQMYTPTSGSEVKKTLYDGLKADPAKTVSIGNFVFRFSSGEPNITIPQIALKTDPRTETKIYIGASQQYDKDGFEYSNNVLTFTSTNFKDFQDIPDVGPPMANYELNIFDIVDITNNKKYKATFYISGPSEGKKTFMIIVERF